MWTSAEGRPIGSRDGVLSGEATPALRTPVGTPTVRKPQACVKSLAKDVLRTHTHSC